MSNNTVTKINEALAKAYAGGSIEEAVSTILGDPGIKAGAKVAIIHDPNYGMEGIQGRVKEGTDKTSGMFNVELENGTIIPMMSNLLVVL